MSRFLTAVIPVTPPAPAKLKFDIDHNIVITMRKPMRGGGSIHMPHVKLGQPVPPERKRITCHRVIVGPRFADFIANKVQCPKEGEALFGFCPHCHTDISGNRIRRVEEQVEFFTTIREVGKHNPIDVINPIPRGSLILSKDNGTFMVVEERTGTKEDVGLKLFVAGTSVKLSVISSDPEYQRIGDMSVGEHWHGPSLVGVDRLLALKNKDTVTIQRTLPSGREEEFVIAVENSWPRIVAAKVIKAALSEPKVEAAPEAPKAEEPATEVKETEAAPELDSTIAKIAEELMASIKPEDSAVEVESIVSLFRHVNDPRHIKRISGEVGGDVTTDNLVRVLVDPIKTMVGLPLMPEHEGREFVFRFGDEMKLVGEVIEAGILRLKTLYGRGNPVDKNRNSVDITK